MSEVPALRDALRVTAEHHHRRRRRRRILRPLAVTAAAVATVALVVSTTRDSAPVEAIATPAPVATPSPAPSPTAEDLMRELEALYAVFRRPARPSDVQRPRRPAFSGVTLHWDRARRVGGAASRFRAYAVPATMNGAPALCTFEGRDDGPGGGGCGALGPGAGGFDPATAMTKPLWAKIRWRPGNLYFLLLPDGVDRVRIRLKDRTVSRPVVDNAVLIQAEGLREITWRAPDGSLHRTRASI